MTTQRAAQNNDRDDARATEARVAAVRRSLEAAIDAHANADAAADARAEDFRTWRRQTIADLIGLSRLCRHRRCRRRRRCVTTGAPCIRVHRDEVCDRLAVLLGYRADELWDDDADLTW